MSNINAHIEQCIRGIEADRDQEIAVIEINVMRDKVAPKNAEIDQKRDSAIQALQTKLNADISALQEAFAAERQAMIEASEKQKEDNKNALIGAETKSVYREYEGKLEELRKLIEA